MNQAIIILSGYNFRAIIAYCRWAKKHDVKFHIIAKNKNDPIFLTEYRRQVFLTRESSSLNPKIFKSWCNDICKAFDYQKIIVLPSTEFLNRFLLLHRNKLESKSCVIPLPNKNLYDLVSDKKSFTELCRLYGLDIPKEYSEIPSKPPFVAKPKSYLSSKGGQLIPQLIKTQTDYNLFQKNLIKEDYFYQELVTGKSLYLLAYIGNNKTILFSQENLMQQDKGGSILLAKKSNFHNSKTAKEFISMLQDKNYIGIIMIEICKDKIKNKNYMIEANPRIWGPLQFCIDNKSKILDEMFIDLNFDIKASNSASEYDGTYYYWSGGIENPSQPIVYHSYDPIKFTKNFYRIKTNDIFLREDTIDVYLVESKINSL